MEAKKEIIFVVMSVFLISLVCAEYGSIPPLPDHFIGNVTLYGTEAPNGTEIMIYVAGNLESVYNVTEKGKYDLYVKTGNVNDNIEFKIFDKVANSSTRQGGKTKILNLELSNKISIPSVDSPAGSPGGGGGGGGGGGTPSVVKDLSYNITTNNTGLTYELQDNKSEIKLDEEISTGFLTGAAIGTIDFIKSKTGIFVFIVFLGTGVMLIKFRFPLKKWIKKVQRRYG